MGFETLTPKWRGVSQANVRVGMDLILRSPDRDVLVSVDFGTLGFAGDITASRDSRSQRTAAGFHWLGYNPEKFHFKM